MKSYPRAEKLQNVAEKVKEKALCWIKFSETYMEKTNYFLNEKNSLFFKLISALYCVSGNVVTKFRINFSKKKDAKFEKVSF